jgi:hypothetical protein
MTRNAPRLQPALKDRLTYLRNREALAMAVLSVLIPYDWIRQGDAVMWALRTPALALFSFILVQGTLYWHFKLRSLEDHKPLPSYFASLFNTLKWCNNIGIAVMVVAVVWAGGAASSKDIGWAVLLIGGAVLEQINYYYFQLMYDTRAAFDFLRRNKRLRKAALGLDIARMK